MSLTKTQSLAASITVGVVSALALLSWSGNAALGRVAISPEMEPLVQPPSAAVQKTCGGIATLKRPPEDKLAAVRRLYRAGDLRNAADYYLAASALSRSVKPDDVLLAHDLGVTAITLGEPRAVSVVTATEDRYLLLTGHPQRFGTQRKGELENGTLEPVDGAITDQLRHALGIPTIHDLRASSTKPKCAGYPAKSAA